MSKETALALVEKNLPAAPLMQIADLKGWLVRLREVANVLTPVAQFDSIPAMHAVSLRAVMVDSRVDAKGNGSDTYCSPAFCKENERALGKRALDMIDAAAGIRTISRYRLDDRSDPWYCEIEVTKGMREVDGTWQQKTKAKAVDLRDGSAGAKMLANSPKMLVQQRSMIQELCETKAGLRVTRELLAIKQKYTIAELERPFVVPKLVPALDPNDPEQKAALIAMATGAVGQLFGSPGPRAGEPVREVRDATPTPSLPAGPTPTPPPPVRQREPGEDDDADETDFEADALDFTEEPEEAPIVCLCRCGDQAALTKEVAEASMKNIGTVRCRTCYPGSAFDVGKHKDMMDEDLGFPNPPYKGLTPARIKAAQDRNRAAKK